MTSTELRDGRQLPYKLKWPPHSLMFPFVSGFRLIELFTMYVSTITALAVLAASASAKQCINTTVPVNLRARQAVFNLAVPQTNLEATDFILNMTQQGRNFTDVVLTGYNTTTGTYNISTQFCMPSNDNSTSPTVQVLTHGIGFDKT
jgi:hypothetical protein